MLSSYPNKVKITIATGFILVAFTLASTSLLDKKLSPRVNIFLHDIVSSSAFLDDVYVMNITALKIRLKNWVDHISKATAQNLCIEVKLFNFQTNEATLSICSDKTSLSGLAEIANQSGVIPINMDGSSAGEIQWIAKSKTQTGKFLVSFLVYLALLIIAFYFGAIYSSYKLDRMIKEKPTNSPNLLRSLHRIMGDNRRVMALHDNWVYGKREHPYITFKNLDGSKLKLRASLSDISTLFPNTCYVSRNEIINTSVEVHEFKGNQVVLHIKTGEFSVDVAPNFPQNIK